MVDVEGHQKTAAEAAEDKRKNDEQELIDGRTFDLAIANTVFTGILMLVGIGGICAALLTLGAIQRQADLMGRQIKLTEASMKQWIEFGEWKSEWVSDSEELAISFQVFNPTNFLLTAELGKMTVKNPAIGILFIYRAAPLAPNRPLSVKFSIPLTPANMQALQGGTIGFSVDGVIVFMSALDVRITQSFSGIITCNRQETKFEAAVALNSLRSNSGQDKAQQNPN